MKIPEDIKIKYTIELEAEDASDLIFIINNHQQLWPEVELRSYALTGGEATPAEAAMILSNYDLSEEYEEEDYE